MRATLLRTKEELEILHEEFRRTVKSFENYTSFWKRMGDAALLEKTDHCLGSGFKAYAYRQAAMYSKLASGARKSWDAAIKFAQGLPPMWVLFCGLHGPELT